MKIRRFKYRASLLSAQINGFINKFPGPRLPPNEIIRVMDIYKKYMFCSGRNVNGTFSRTFLYYIMERMYNSNFNDSKYVATLLNFLFITEGHLQSVMVPSIEKCPQLLHTNVYEFFEYFIRHAYNEQAVFGGERLLCMEMLNSRQWQYPLTMVVSIPDPNLLHLILRYGALLSFSEQHRHKNLRKRGFAWCGESVLVRVLFEIVTLNPKLLPMNNLTLIPLEMERYLKYVSCCELLLRDFNYLSPNLIYSGVRFRLFQLDISDSSGFIDALSANVIRNFRMHFKEPTTLKHQCRLSIRRILNEKWLLPHAINDLLLPKPLKLYID